MPRQQKKFSPPIVYTVVSQFTMEPIWSLGLFCRVHYCRASSFITVLYSTPPSLGSLRLLKPQKMMNNSSSPPPLIFLSPFCSASIRLCSPQHNLLQTKPPLPLPSHPPLALPTSSSPLEVLTQVGLALHTTETIKRFFPRFPDWLTEMFCHSVLLALAEH